MPRPIHFLAALTLLAGTFEPAFAHLSILRQGPESAGALNDGDYFGLSMAVGDFNGDGIDDLATGAPGETLDGNPSGGPFTGSVVISYGSATGLTHVGAQYLTGNIIGGPENGGMQFGFALAAADFNLDGFSDLVISAPWDEEGGTVGGRIYVLRGTAAGLFTGIWKVIEQGNFFEPEEIDDDFGWALAIGYFNGDGYPDLAIGSPGEDFDMGAVFYMTGGPGGPEVPAGVTKFTPFSLGFGGVAGRRFGESLTGGNFYGDGFGDLAVGAPNEVVGGLIKAGAVYLIKGSGTGLTGAGSLQYTASSFDAAAAQAQFGRELADGHFGDGTYRYLAIGEPGRAVNGWASAGRVLIVRGSLAGLDWALMSRQLIQGAGTLPELNDKYGSALAAGDWTGDGTYGDLAVGAPGEDGDIGQIHVYSGAAGGLTTLGSQTFFQSALGDSSETDDTFGYTLAMGRFDLTGQFGLVASAPGENTSDDVTYDANGIDVEEYDNAGQISVILPWRQPVQLDSHHAASVDCESELVFSQRPFDKIRVASTTKVMTLLLACERIDLPETNPDHVDLYAPYEVPSWLDLSAGYVTGSMSNVFATGQIWDLQSLMWTTLYISANDCAFAIGDLLTGGDNDWTGTDDTLAEFVAQMNARAGTLGMTRTHFTNPAGKDWGDAHSCAADMAKLSRAAMQNTRFRAMSLSSGQVASYLEPGEELETTLVLANSPYGIYTLVNPAATGIKTGNTAGAMRCFVSSADGPAFGDIAIATGFGWPPAVSRNADLVQLLGLSLAGCGVPGVPIESRTPPVTEAGALMTMANVPMAQDSARLAGIEPDGIENLGDLQVDVLRQSGSGATALQVALHRGGGVTIPHNGSVTWGVKPFEAHAGLLITNADTANTAILQLSQNHPPTSGPLNLAPLASIFIPPFASPGTSYVMTILNNGNFPAQIDVKELGYVFNLTTTSPPGSTMLSAELRRRGRILEDGLVVRAQGLDANPGSQAFISVHEVGTTAGVDPPLTPRATISDLTLMPARPTPFAGMTRIPFRLARPGGVGLSIFDLRGRRLRELSAGERGVGEAELVWDGRDASGSAMPAGIYFARFRLDGVHAGATRLVRLER